MDTLELLTTRRSNKSLRAPAPDELQLDSILQAASQVPDHGNLTPWRFIVIQSEAGKQRFQAALRETAITLNMGEKNAGKSRARGQICPAGDCRDCQPQRGQARMGTANERRLRRLCHPTRFAGARL